MVEGCIHIHIKDSEIKNIFCHLSGVPENGVIHLSPDQVMTDKEFIESHPHDKHELKVSVSNKIHDLGSDSV